MLFTPPVFNKTIEPIITVQKKEEPKPAPKLYTIVPNDTLTSIAKAQNVPLERLWAANTDLSSPDLIEPSKTLKVPLETDVLTPREMPIRIEASTTVERTGIQTSAPSGRSSVSMGTGTGGNTYYAGQCTAFVKDSLGWVENGWGNASDWKYTSGHKVSSVPAVGTIAWAKGYGHVAIVTGIGNGTVTVSEQNYNGPFVISSRVAPTSEFEYIYP